MFDSLIHTADDPRNQFLSLRSTSVKESQIPLFHCHQILACYRISNA